MFVFNVIMVIFLIVGILLVMGRNVFKVLVRFWILIVNIRLVFLSMLGGVLDIFNGWILGKLNWLLWLIIVILICFVNEMSGVMVVGFCLLKLMIRIGMCVDSSFFVRFLMKGVLVVGSLLGVVVVGGSSCVVFLIFCFWMLKLIVM